jgi:hypothetical protein
MGISTVPAEAGKPNAACEVCGGSIPEKRQRRKAKTCKDSCVAKKQTTMYDEINGARLDVPSVTLTSIAELRVGTDLMRKGMQVFRAMGPHPDGCDLLAIDLEDGSKWRIEVVSGVLSTSKKIVHSKKPDITKHDIIAVYLARQDRIEYQPILEMSKWRIK